MKIISKFKDYYDGGMALGVDNTIHYLRSEVDVEVNGDILNILDPKGWTSLDSHYPRNRFYNKRKIESYYTRYLLFCGKCYPIVHYSYITDGQFMSDKVNNVLCGYDECLDFFQQIQGNKSNWRYSDLVELYVKIFKSFTDKLIIEEHVRHESPILYYYISGEWKVTLNKRLKDLQFYRVVDTYTAFQEIGMFLGSTLCDVSTPKMPVGDDKVLLNSKGFDPKHGFRTRPNKRK